MKLFTGVTGFVGGATLAQWLSDRPAERTLLWVRADHEDHARRRIAATLARYLEVAAVDAALARCDLIVGDLLDPRALADPRLDDVTHVLHLASNTSFRSVRGVRRANLLGGMALAHRMRRAPRLERFVYVGTGYICGEITDPVVYEEQFPALEASHFTEYTRSKSECEMLLALSAADLPLVVARPSVVVGHSTLGCGPSGSIFWFYRLAQRLRRISCAVDSRGDVVPVDWVARALLLLLDKASLAHRCYHLSAGLGASRPWHAIAAALAAAEGDTRDTPFECLDWQEAAQLSGDLSVLGPVPDPDYLSMALCYYYRFMATGPEVFDNQRLLAEGMPAPLPYPDYIGRCVETSRGTSIYEQMTMDG